jgi:glycosyltransferase involved in cell wall biosynthesis
MTNIVFIAPFPPHTGGIAYYSGAFLKNAPTEFSIRAYGFERVFPKMLYPGKASTDPSLRLPGVTYPFTGFNPLTWRRAGILPVPEGPGILLLPWWTAAIYPALAGIRNSFKRAHPDWKVVLWCHNVREHERRPGSEWLARRMFEKADAFIVHSDKAREELLEIEPDARILKAFLPLHPLPVPLPEKKEARQRLNLPEEKLVPLFLGTVRPYKGLEALEAAVREFQSDKRVQWVVAGDFWKGTEQFRRSTEAAGARVLAGYQSWETVAHLMAACDLMVLPYRHASGSGILMQAYAHGIPFLVSATEHLKDYLPADYPTLRPGDQEGLQQLIRGFSDHPEALIHLKDKVLEQSKAFTWGEFFARVRPFVEHLVL